MFMESLKLTWISKILLTTNKYFTVIKELYPGITERIMFGNTYLEDRRIRINNYFWNNVINSFKTFGTIAKPKDWLESLSVPLWCNTCSIMVLYTCWRFNSFL